ncbi:hypothetical protein [Nocardia rosealba]|uniref:hypothetical protein n=1 Tax=Nocardia rosealba TaxID=2878563 RepID=UPI001CD9E5C5|nr:hypothetical protein [Nocardia rosealba]MCA2210300.1 hypothetical protein [Nocardia rosealba]
MQDDVDDLFADCVDFAQSELRQHRSFSPFAFVINDAGQRAARTTDSVSTSKNAIHDALTFGRDAGELRAFAVAMDVDIPASGEDAIEVHIEHRSGIAIELLVPYASSTDGIALDLTRISAAQGQRRIWGLRL